MPELRAEGITILVLFVVLFVIFSILGIYCHFCAEVDSGGHYYRSDENLAEVVFIKGSEGQEPTRNKCKCSRHFKGSCKHCEGDDFVNDGDDGKHPDFGGFGGDKGLDNGSWGNSPNPLSVALTPTDELKSMMMMSDG